MNQLYNNAWNESLKKIHHFFVHSSAWIEHKGILKNIRPFKHRTNYFFVSNPNSLPAEGFCFFSITKSKQSTEQSTCVDSNWARPKIALRRPTHNHSMGFFVTTSAWNLMEYIYNTKSNLQFQSTSTQWVFHLSSRSFTGLLFNSLHSFLSWIHIE
jgi:hypothetical protein